MTPTLFGLDPKSHLACALDFCMEYGAERFDLIVNPDGGPETVERPFWWDDHVWYHETHFVVRSRLRVVVADRSGASSNVVPVLAALGRSPSDEDYAAFDAAYQSNYRPVLVTGDGLYDSAFGDQGEFVASWPVL